MGAEPAPREGEDELGLAPRYDPAVWGAADAATGGLRSVRAELPYADGSFEVDVCDARGEPSRFALPECGFELISSPSALAREVFYDARRVVREYYPEVAEVVRRKVGAALVLPYHHSVRHDGRYAAEREGPKEARTSNLVGPARFVHNDQSASSGYDLVAQKLAEAEGSEAVAAATAGRFLVVNAWRAVAPVERDPLAVVDWRSLSPGDGYGPAGEWYSPWHRWFFFSGMLPEELLLFKQFDTRSDEARCVVHSTFEDPGTAETAGPRESIDVRCLAFFGPLPPGFGDAFTASLLLGEAEEGQPY